PRSADTQLCVSRVCGIGQCTAFATGGYPHFGAFAQGVALGEEGLRIAEAAAHPWSLMFADHGVGLLFLRRGDLRQTLPRPERAVGLCQEADLLNWFPRMAAALGAVYTLAGRIADAVPLLTQAMEQSLARESVQFEILCGLSLGEAQMLAGHLEEAYVLADRTLEHARRHQERSNQAYALRLLGDIAAHRNPLESEQPEAYYHQALALANEPGMRPLMAHCHRGLGTLYGRVGREQQARAALSTAIALYRAMEMTFWLPQTEVALAQVEAASAPQAG